MKFAIISNVDKSDDKFVTGSKTIRSIISITPENKFIEEKINGQITRIEFKLAAEVKDKIDGILLNHIETHIGKKIPIGVTSTEAGLFLTKIKEKYVLSCQEETVGGWFGTTTKQAKEIGKYSVMPLDNDYSVEALEAERLKELMGIITSARNDRNETMGQLASLECTIKHLKAENNYLKDLMQKRADAEKKSEKEPF